MEEIKANIEKNKIEKLEQIKNQTQEKLKKLEEKYSTMDKVGSSFAGLAYATIGVFLFFIAIGDFVRFFKYISQKLRPIKVKALRTI